MSARRQSLLKEASTVATMKSLLEHLSTYASYHRDRRNIATHFVGIPMILFSITAFLARPSFAIGETGFAIAPVHVVGLGAAVFYFLLDVRYGLVMAVFLALNVWGATALAAQSTAVWAGVAGAMFVVGWIFQLVGHVWEGKKPAFVDDLVGLLIGPLFVVAEAGFFVGIGRGVNEEIERAVGPTRINSRKAAASAA